jgi:copper chaperone CopZ
MKFLLPTLLLATALPAMAQVERAAMKTQGISCGVCAAVSEVYLRKLPGIDQISISKRNEAVMVSYKPGSSFQPKDLRDALGKTDATIVQIQISARGRAQEQAGKQFFIAGKDKFVIVSAPNSPQVPKDIPVLIEGVVNDRVAPMELRVMTVKPLSQ